MSGLSWWWCHRRVSEGEHTGRVLLKRCVTPTMRGWKRTTTNTRPSSLVSSLQVQLNIPVEPHRNSQSWDEEFRSFRRQSRSEALSKRKRLPLQLRFSYRCAQTRRVCFIFTVGEGKRRGALSPPCVLGRALGNVRGFPFVWLSYTPSEVGSVHSPVYRLASRAVVRVM